MTAAVIYPSVIARACAALDESPAFRDLPDGYFRVVVRIVKKINLARLHSPIVASRGKLAEESGKSVETVGRVIKWLEGRGLIQRHQKARAGLRGSSSPLVPTQKLLTELLLTGAPARTINPADETQPCQDANGSQLGKPIYPQETSRSGVSADGSKSMVQTLSNHSENSQRNGAALFVEIDKVKIPQDLTWLVTRQGLRATAVLALMKAAKEAKQRLSEVVAATRRYLEPLEGRELFAYLTALLKKDRDYGYQVKEEAKLSRAQNDKERLERKALELEGRKFVTRDGKITVFVESGGFLTEIHEGRRCCRPIHITFLEALENGRLQAVDR